MAKEITASDIKRMMLGSYRRFVEGEISEAKAFRESVLLGNILKAIEVSETEERLRRIEEALSSPLNDSYEDD